jgi:hypothetical protein
MHGDEQLSRGTWVAAIEAATNALIPPSDALQRSMMHWALPSQFEFVAQVSSVQQSRSQAIVFPGAVAHRQSTHAVVVRPLEIEIVLSRHESTSPGGCITDGPTGGIIVTGRPALIGKLTPGPLNPPRAATPPEELERSPVSRSRHAAKPQQHASAKTQATTGRPFAYSDRPVARPCSSRLRSAPWRHRFRAAVFELAQVLTGVNLTRAVDAVVLALALLHPVRDPTR